jgi:hypothetical protein
MPKKSKIERIIHIGLYRPEAEVVSKIEETGYELSDIIREMIRSYGDAHFPEEKSYAVAARIRAEQAQKKVEAEVAFKTMPNEQYATEVLRGKVEGEKVLFRMPNGTEVNFSLATIKEQTIENNAVIKFHNQLLDKTFRYPGDKEPTDDQYAQIWKGW